MKPVTVGDCIELFIESLGFKGYGIARLPSRFVVFVPFTAPGDTAKVQIKTVKKRHALGDLVSLKIPSPMRVSPKCSYFGFCGGCQWQHIAVEEQRRAKEAIVSSAFAKALGKKLPLMKVYGDRSYNYRNRIQVHRFHGQTGFFGRHSKELVTIKSCSIADERLNDALSLLDKSPDGTYELRIVASGEVEIRKGRNTEFTQVNTELNLQLLRRMKHHLQSFFLGSGTRVFDLYGGSGNFTLGLADVFPNWFWWVVDEQMKLAQSLRSQTIEWIEEKVESFLAQRTENIADVWILDPPRQGLSREFHSMLSKYKKKPQAVIYISCDPMTAARDLRSFKENGFELSVTEIFDFFPQTFHVETMNILRLSPI